MEHARLKKFTVISSTLTKIAGSPSPARWAALIIAVLMGSVLLAAVVRAYNHSRPETLSVTKHPSVFPSLQAAGKLRADLHSRLSLQPEADRFRRRLGQRFLTSGREKTLIIGTLTIGSNPQPVTIARAQADDGEGVQIALGGGLPSLSWNASEGAKSGAVRASTDERQLIERVALDSPDQFILAQLRGTSYYTIARNVMPSEARGSEDYNGPVWDVVRVSERQDEAVSLLLSPTRHYFINSSTGLLEKVVSEEQGDAIVAELSGWLNQGNEIVPTRIVWKRNGQVLMQLTVTNLSTGPRQ
ncbi:MAG: hypothetical protein AABN33_19830 [Acidobacteriota bacterium]